MTAAQEKGSFLTRHCKFASPIVLTTLLASTPAHASESNIAVGVMGMVLCAALVFFMQAGFALLESGMVRSKNCVNVIMKNYSDREFTFNAPAVKDVCVFRVKIEKLHGRALGY